MSDQVGEVSQAYHADVAGSVVAEGYKQTEVGVIPEDWAVLSVGEAFEICNFLRFPISAKIREGMVGEYPYYGPTKIQDHIDEYRVEGEFALIGEDGDHFLKFDTVSQTQYATGKFNVNNHAHLVKGRMAAALWFFYYYRNRDISNHLTRQGAGRFKLNKASLEAMLCAIPNRIEQTAIANALSDVDALISEQEKLIAKKQAIKTAAMQQLLTGRTRLSPFALREDGAPKGYKQSELGEVPEDWEARTIAEQHVIATGNTPPTSDLKNYGEEYLFVSPADLGNEKYILNSGKKLSNKGYSLARKIPSGSTLFTCIGSTIGKTGYASIELTSNQQINAVFPNDESDSEFTYYALTHIAPRIKELAGEQAVPLVNKTEFGETCYSLPSDKGEQKAIATILTNMDEEIQILQHRLAKTRQIKQGMMQELLTGKTRLLKPSVKESANV